MIAARTYRRGGRKPCRCEADVRNPLENLPYSTRMWVAAGVLVAPLMWFIFLLVVSPSTAELSGDAELFARTIAAGMADPLILCAVVASFLAGWLGASWIILAIAASAAGS